MYIYICICMYRKGEGGIIFCCLTSMCCYVVKIMSKVDGSGSNAKSKNDGQHKKEEYLKRDEVMQLSTICATNKVQMLKQNPTIFIFWKGVLGMINSVANCCRRPESNSGQMGYSTTSPWASTITRQPLWFT